MATPVPAQIPSPEAPQRERRAAILYISGLGASTAAGIAERIAHALDRATDPLMKYAVLPGADEVSVRSDDFTLARATVKRTAPDGTTAALDVWRLATAKPLTAGYEKAGLFTKLARGGSVVWRYRRKVTTLFRNGRLSKDHKDRAQLNLVRAAVVLLGIYFLALLVAFAGEATTVLGKKGWLPEEVTAAVLGFTGLAIWKANWVKRLTDSAVQLHCLIDYVGEGESVEAFRGQVADALQHFAEREDIEYETLDVVAYSFGSVVALDAIFPRAHEPGAAFENIGTLVTIGCPYDLLRTYWPKYYTERHHRSDVPQRWINYYSPRDVLGSNFRANNGGKRGVGIQGAKAFRPAESFAWVTVAAGAEPIKWWQVFGVPGMKAHAIYWEGEHDESVFSHVVRELYAGRSMLG